MKLFAGSSHPELAEAIAKELGVELGKVKLKNFSSGERYVKYEQSVRGQDVWIVQTAGTGSVNEDLIELFLMCQAAKLSRAPRRCWSKNRTARMVGLLARPLAVPDSLPSVVRPGASGCPR